MVIKPLPVPDFSFSPTNTAFLGAPVVVGFGNTPPPNATFYADPLYTDSVVIDWGDNSPNWSTADSCGSVTGWNNFNLIRWLESKF